MKKLLRYLNLQTLGLMISGSSVAALAFAYTAEYGFGLLPCILCLYQRIPYAVNIVIGIFAFLSARRIPLVSTILSALSVPAYLSGAGLAFFQVGVEQKWWHGFSGCSAPDLTGLSGKALLEAINNTPAVSCDKVQFELFGISMAGYNGLLSLGLVLSVIAALVIIKAGRR
jgi:disulfide bond formation protein DsbB